MFSYTYKTYTALRRDTDVMWDEESSYTSLCLFQKVKNEEKSYTFTPLLTFFSFLVITCRYVVVVHMKEAYVTIFFVYMGTRCIGTGNFKHNFLL